VLIIFLQANLSLPELQGGDVFNPMSSNHQDAFSNPTARKPLKNHVYIMKETPYLTNLSLAFQEALNRPITYHNQQRYTVMVRCMEHIAVPVALVSPSSTSLTCIFCSLRGRTSRNPIKKREKKEEEKKRERERKKGKKISFLSDAVWLQRNFLCVKFSRSNIIISIFLYHPLGILNLMIIHF